MSKENLNTIITIITIAIIIKIIIAKISYSCYCLKVKDSIWFKL